MFPKAYYKENENLVHHLKIKKGRGLIYGSTHRENDRHGCSGHPESTDAHCA